MWREYHADCNGTFSSSECMASDGGTINEWRFGKRVEERWRSISQATIQEFARSYRETRKESQDSVPTESQTKYLPYISHKRYLLDQFMLSFISWMYFFPPHHLLSNITSLLVYLLLPRVRRYMRVVFVLWNCLCFSSLGAELGVCSVDVTESRVGLEIHQTCSACNPPFHRLIFRGDFSMKQRTYY
jgi:hypothetical protein